MKKEKGITLIVLVITVVILLILTGVTAKFVLDDRLVEESEEYTNKINDQIKEQESVSNMVRELYNNS